MQEEPFGIAAYEQDFLRLKLAHRLNIQRSEQFVDLASGFRLMKVVQNDLFGVIVVNSRISLSSSYQFRQHLLSIQRRLGEVRQKRQRREFLQLMVVSWQGAPNSGR